MKERIFDKFFDRIKFITKKSTSKDIAKLLCLPNSTFSEKKRKDQIPYEEVVKFCEKYDVDIVWLLDMKDTSEQTNEQVKIINKNRAEQIINCEIIISKKDLKNIYAVDNDGGITMPNFIMIRKNTTSSEKCILSLIWQKSLIYGNCNLNNEMISKHLGKTTMSIKNLLSRLKKRELIKIIGAKNSRKIILSHGIEK